MLYFLFFVDDVLTLMVVFVLECLCIDLIWMRWLVKYLVVVIELVYNASVIVFKIM